MRLVLICCIIETVSVPAYSSEATHHVSAITVVDKSIRGAETVRALLQNESGRPIVAVTDDVKFYVALAPSDPTYTSIPAFLTPSRVFHILGGPCEYAPTGGATNYTVDGKAPAPPPNTPQPTFSTSPFEVVVNGTTEPVGPMQHFDDFHCGDATANSLRLYSVIQWKYSDSGASASDVQTTTSPIIAVSIP
jgi:hypothetical protein